MIRANWESDLLNQLNHEAFELKCHDQQRQSSSWAKTETLWITVDLKASNVCSKSCFCAMMCSWVPTTNYHKDWIVRYSFGCL